MPAVRTYLVTQVRRVEVSAIGPAEAIDIGRLAFEDKAIDTQAAGGRLTSKVRVKSLSVDEA